MASVASFAIGSAAFALNWIDNEHVGHKEHSVVGDMLETVSCIDLIAIAAGADDELAMNFVVEVVEMMVVVAVMKMVSVAFVDVLDACVDCHYLID